MDSDEEITWLTTKNTVKDRMIESSLIHRFTDSKKTRRRTELLNDLLKRYRNLSTHQDYVMMKKLVNKKIRMDREIEDDDSYGEDDYLISHKRNLSLINGTMCSNKNIGISRKSTCNSNTKKPKDMILKKKDTSFISSAPNKISSTDSDSSKKERIKRLKTLRINDANDNVVPIKKTRLLDLPERCLETVKETQLEDNEKYSSNSFNTTDSRVLSETTMDRVNPESESIENATTKRDKPKNDTCSLNSPLQRSPPKVTSIEIINRRYKIINKEKPPDGLPNECYSNIRLVQSSSPLSFLQYKEEEKSESNEEYEDSMNSSTLSLLERRQQQLKHLNLTLESTSSSSEDDMSQKTDNVTKISALNNLHCTTSKKNTTCNKLKLNGSCDTNYKKDKNSFNTPNMTNNINHSNGIDQHGNYNEDLTKHKNASSKNVEPTILALGGRPRNLENFINEGNLVQDTTASAFTLQDFSKDEDIFLVDIPITINLADLQGHRITLKKKSLKLGKNKYQTLYKDISTQSCVFSTCGDSKPYKLVNIKPTGSVIVKRKLSLSVPKYSKENTKSYTNVFKNK